MKKRSGYLILAIVLIVFSVVAFAAPFEKTPVFWVSFAFGLLAICFQIPLWNKSLRDTKKQILRLPSAAYWNRLPDHSANSLNNHDGCSRNTAMDCYHC